jgi:uncharacterized protein (TIGR04255 family)
VTFENEAWERLRFEHTRNPLKVVVAQVRFPPAYALGDAAVQATIQRSLADRFPRALEPIQEVTFAVTPQGPTAPQTEQTAVRFADAEGKRIVAIGPAMASYETTDYEGWEQFEAMIELVLQTVAEHATPTEYLRFGLRYVDEIVVDGVVTIDDWGDILEDRVLGTPDSMLRDPRVAETSQQTRLRIGDDDLRFRNGYVQLDNDGERRSIYVLDTDLSTTGPNAWDITEIRARANRYHDWMTMVFGRSLSPAGIERLGGAIR